MKNSSSWWWRGAAAVAPPVAPPVPPPTRGLSAQRAPSPRAVPARLSLGTVRRATNGPTGRPSRPLAKRARRRDNMVRQIFPECYNAYQKSILNTGAGVAQEWWPAIRALINRGIKAGVGFARPVGLPMRGAACGFPPPAWQYLQAGDLPCSEPVEPGQDCLGSAMAHRSLAGEYRARSAVGDLQQHRGAFAQAGLRRRVLEADARHPLRFHRDGPSHLSYRKTPRAVAYRAPTDVDV